MGSELTLKLNPERIKEMPMVDLAFEVLKAANTPYYYRDLMKEIAAIRGLSEEEINQVIAQVYTEINIDGRFACVGSNMWGLKRWYPVEKSEDPVGNAKRPRIINDEDDDDDIFAEEEEETYTAEDEEYDVYDEDSEDMFAEGDEDAEVDEEVGIDDEELEEEVEGEEINEELDSEEEDGDYDDDSDDEEEDTK